MSDNTPNDGTKNSEADAAVSADETLRSADEQTVPADSAEPKREPLVIDYDAIEANLSDADNSSAAHATPSVPDLTPMSTAKPVATADADADAPRLADDYADERVGASDGATGDANVVEAVAVVAAAPLYAPAAPAPIYVQAPSKPRDRSNRGGGILIALLATLAFTVLYAVAAFIIIGVTSTTLTATSAGFRAFAELPVFYVPVIFFFLSYAGLIALINRGGWWAYVLFGFLVAVVVYFSYIGAALLSVQAWNFTPDEAYRFVSQQWLNPGAIAAAVVAREVPIWTGAWIARRGRSVTARNATTKAEYDRLLADGPQGIRSN